MLVVTSQIHAKHSAEVKSTNQDVVITLHQTRRSYCDGRLCVADKLRKKHICKFLSGMKVICL